MNTSLGHFIRTVALAAGFFLPAAMAVAQAPVAGPNVNMVTGTKWPEGDPFLTKQNEPSLAISSRNPRHVLAGANDYRLVPIEVAEKLDEPEAWITLFKSVDGGTTWRANVLGGCPLNIPECLDTTTGLTSALRALAPNYGADATVRPGPFGTFFVSFIAGTRDTGANGTVAIQRFVDKNDDIQREADVRQFPADPANPNNNQILRLAQDPILPDSVWLVDTGVKGQFKDKPWNAADVPGRPWNAGQPKCELLSWTKNRTGDGIKDSSELVDPFNVYVSYANFVGQSANQHPQVEVAVSTDCGKTFGKPQKLSNSLQATSGTSIAIDPVTGAVYVAWRSFGDPAASPPKPDGIYISKSTDGGKTWSNQPIAVLAQFYAYDQPASGVSFRTLAFPTVAVSASLENGVLKSRVHVAWAQRTAPPGLVSPYACTSTNPANCDARIVMSTSTDGGNTWRAAQPVDRNLANSNNPANPAGRGHQVQPALTFAAGRLMITWLDQRLDQTEGVLKCLTGTCGTVADLQEVREAKGNLDANCAFPAGVPSPLVAGASCYKPDAVWTTYLTDGTPYLVRRHTLDVFAAMAPPSDTPSFSSGRVSSYQFGSTVAVDANGNLTKVSDLNAANIRQKEVNAPNLPMFSNGTAAFLGDYIDAAGQAIVAVRDPVNPNKSTYKFNVGCNGSPAACGAFTTGGLSPAFIVSFTDNRKVIPPKDGNWTSPKFLTQFTTDSAGNITGVANDLTCQAPGTLGFSGNRDQNVYASVVTEGTLAFANANSKYLTSAAPRGFVVTVQNFDTAEHTYTLAFSASGPTVSFDKASFDSTSPKPFLLSIDVTVQPRSSSTRTLWIASGTPNASVVVTVTRPGGAFSTQIPLNPDPNAGLVKNGDADVQATAADTANDDLGGVVVTNLAPASNPLGNVSYGANAPQTNSVLGNVVLGNVVLGNAVLGNVVLGNDAQGNVVLGNFSLGDNVLGNVVLGNNVLGNAGLGTVVLSNNALGNVVLGNVVLGNNVLGNVVLGNDALGNVVLGNAVLGNAVLGNTALLNNVLGNNTLLNVPTTNLDPSNVVLGNAVLGNNVLGNAVLGNNVLGNNVLGNVVLGNNVVTNAVLGNVVLGNAALGNAVLGNNVLGNVVLGNAALQDDVLTTVEPANVDLTKNNFAPSDLQNSKFADATFTVRNRGNTDTTLAIKLLLRDADCSSGTCTLPGNVKLQLVLRKIALTPTAVPPTAGAASPYTTIGGANVAACQIGLEQSNALVSNIASPMIASVDDPNLGSFDPNDKSAATLPLSPGERAYVTLRAIGTGGQAVDPTEFLRWGAKFVVVDASNNSRTRIPLIIKTLTLPAVTAVQPASLSIKTFGGFGTATGTATCADSQGNTGSALPANTSCLPSAAVGTFVTDASGNGTAPLMFTPDQAGTFYLLVNVKDGSVPPQSDQQLLKIVVNPATPTFTFNTGNPNFPSQLPFGQTYDLALLLTAAPPLLTSDSTAPITFATDPATATAPNPAPADVCTVGPPPTYTLTPVGVGQCTFLVQQGATVAYASISITSPPVTIVPGNQTIAFGALADKTYGDAPFAVSASGGASGNPVTFAASGSCTVAGSTVTISGTGSCAITASQAGSPPYYNAAQAVTQSFTLNKRPVTVTADARSKVYGTTDPALTYQITSGTLAGTDAFSGALTRAAGEIVGIYGIAQGTLVLSANYELTYVGANFAITPRPITVTADAKTKVYGGADPALTYRVTGGSLVGSDSFNGELTRAAGENVGTFAITQGTLTLGANYLLTYVGANLTITARPVTVTADAKTKVYGAIDPALTYQITSGTLAGTDAFSGGLTRAAGEIVGVHAIQQGTLALGTNYALTYIGANLTIGKAATATTVTVANATYDGGAHGGTANVTGPSGLSQSLTVTYTGTGATTYPASTTAPTAAGSYIASASYAESANYLGSNDSKPFTIVTTATTTGLVSSTAAAAFGQSVTLTATVTAPGTGTPTGSVTFKDGTTPLGSATIAGGTAVYLANTLSVGSHSLTAVYGGDANDLGSTSVPVTVTINKVATTTSLVSDKAVAGYGTAVNLTATVVPSTATGTVTFRDGTATLGTATLSSLGKATLAASALTVGTHTLTASYGGDSNDAASTSTPITVTINALFTATGSMAQPRSDHTATLLNDGRVLVAGGFDASGVSTATSEVYCPTSMAAPTASLCQNGVGKFSTIGTLPSKSAGHTATLLANGKVLATGGGNSSAELFDPTTNSWSSAGGFSSVRSYHTATRLANGNVLFTGGAGNSGTTLKATILYNVATGTFTSGPSMTAARERHTATLLPNGKVLLAGGRASGGSSSDSDDISYVVLNSAEIYDPATNTFTAAPTMNSRRDSHAAALLVNGKILVAGGGNGTSTVATAEVYDPATNAWATTGSMQTARRGHSLTVLTNGKVLAAGGKNSTGRLNSAELFDPAQATFQPVTSAMTAYRAAHTATLLNDGTVLVVGGTGGAAAAGTTSVNSAELYGGPPGP